MKIKDLEYKSTAKEGAPGKLTLTSADVNSNSEAESPLDGGVVHRLQSIENDSEFESEISRLETSCAPTELWRIRVHRLLKRKALEEAIALINARDFDERDEASLLEKAELLHDARDHEGGERLFEELLARNPDSIAIRMAYAKRLLPMGKLVRARNLLVIYQGVFPEENWRRGLVDKTLSLFNLLSRLESDPLEDNQDARIVAMKHAILRFRDREVRPHDGRGMGRLTLITGSLGPGGAERQLTRLAIELERARKAGRPIGDIPLNQPVELLVRSHGPERQNDFYLAEVQREGCELRQINLFEPLNDRALGVTDPILSQLLHYLPPPVNYGVRRLTKHFEESRTDTASIWQDGACLFASLAALMAGVPHVQLAIRGLPPSMRRHMFRPEYEVLYRAMAQIPGVRFVSNSVSAARAYAEWLHLPLDRFDIIYNGVEPMTTDPSEECARKWNHFIEMTKDAEHTIGGVFRFDVDKQPTLWIRFAARHLKRHPKSRFILVGSGRLLPNAQQLAEELGISDRILFVGHSSRVGFWMSKMDALVLLSRYEGLPNVLIEAQYMGVRVVTTPAGGAAECLIDGTTGYVLECAEKPDLDQLVDRVHNLALRSSDRELFNLGSAGRTFLDRHFSIPRMLEEFVGCTVRGLRAADDFEEFEERRIA